MFHLISDLVNILPEGVCLRISVPLLSIRVVTVLTQSWCEFWSNITCSYLVKWKAVIICFVTHYHVLTADEAEFWNCLKCDIVSCVDFWWHWTPKLFAVWHMLSACIWRKLRFH